MSTVTIDYIGHSGFLAETEEVLMLFDYYQGDLSMLDEKPAEKPLFVFASHVHGDHFNPQIFDLAKGERNVTYLLSFDIRKSSRMPEVRGLKVSFLDAGRAYEIPGLGKVETLLSTDEGVAFLVDTGSAVIYHAGDLNWWHWEDEGKAYCANMAANYRRSIAKLAADVRDESADCGCAPVIDVAMAPLDPRLEDAYDMGIAWLLEQIPVRTVFPMHIWEKYDWIDRYCREHPADADRIVRIRENGTVFEV